MVDQLPLCSWYDVTCVYGKWHKEGGEIPAENDRFNKLQIDVQGNKLRNLAEDLCKMKRWNGVLVGTFLCDDILFPWNTFSDEGIRENFNEEFQPCPDGNSSNHLGSERYKPNAASDKSESALAPTVIS